MHISQEDRTDITVATGAETNPGSDWPIEGLRLSIGDRLGERYRIVRFLARGAAGEVYAARDEALGIAVALKTLRGERCERSALERFRREAVLTRGLIHPGLCRVFDLGLHGGPARRVPFLTMELLAGETLADRLARRGALPPVEVRQLAAKLASALAVLHGAGLVHRDLKPSNIMMGAGERGERVVIVDFGLARLASSWSPPGRDGDRSRGRVPVDPFATTTGALVGSPAYMAPEQVAGGAIGPATDIYSLGIVLFEAVTGRLPFQASSLLGMAISRLEQEPPSPRSIRPELHPAWDAVLARCLARAAESRFPRVEDVPRALADALDTSPRKRPTAPNGSAVWEGPGTSIVTSL